jgi:hypothetical protein
MGLRHSPRLEPERPPLGERPLGSRCHGAGWHAVVGTIHKRFGPIVSDTFTVPRAKAPERMWPLQARCGRRPRWMLGDANPGVLIHVTPK